MKGTAEQELNNEPKNSFRSYIVGIESPQQQINLNEFMKKCQRLVEDKFKIPSQKAAAASTLNKKQDDGRLTEEKWMEIRGLLTEGADNGLTFE